MKKKVLIHHLGTAALAGLLSSTAGLAQASPPAPAPLAKAVAPELNRKLSKGLQETDPGQTVSVIVQFHSTDSTRWDNSMLAVSGRVHKHFQHIRAVAAEMSASQLEQLANDPDVSFVSLDRPLASKGLPGLPAPLALPGAGPAASAQAQSIATGPEYTAEPINAPALWQQGYFGTGIGVAVIDSGISPNPDLNWMPGLPVPAAGMSRVVYSASFPSTLAGGTSDPYGHGTHVAGLIGGNGTQSLGLQYDRAFVGVAPNVQLINLRVLDANGQGTDSTVIDAIETAISLKNTYNIRIINLSLGRPVWESYTQDPLCQAVEAAWKAGIVVVVAAGNDGRNDNLNPEGYGTIEAPGNDPYVITVGAMNPMNTATVQDDTVASYSSKGPSFIDDVAKPDIVAPGNLVTSLLAPGSNLQSENPTFFTPTSFYVRGGNNTASPAYMPLSGTSMATGVTSGAIALLLQADPQLTPDQVKAILMLSAQRSYFPSVSVAVDPVSGASYVEHYDALTVGAGYLDIRNALNEAEALGSSLPQGTAMSPTVSYDSNTGDATMVTDQTALWGSTALWGASDVYGANAFVSGSTALWGRTALWGANDPAGFTALWGATALWGRSTPDAATALWGASTVAGSTALWGRTVTDSD